MTEKRQYDLALFGATGFTGGLTADYLAANSPVGLTWALVGRNVAKLEAVRARLAEASPAAPIPDLLEADAADASALQRVAESARVIATTVGPYGQHGDALVAACRAQRTHYANLAGEPLWIRRMIDRHHEAARVDRQLIGRAARQGDPGSCQFFLSLEDEILEGPGQGRQDRVTERGYDAATGARALDVLNRGVFGLPLFFQR